MRLALVGYGKMGKLIEQIARSRRHEITAIIDPYEEGADAGSVSAAELSVVDVCIDFTRPDAVMDTIRNLAKRGKNMVIGTTGWYDDLDEAKETTKKAEIGLIYASNFSLGMNLFFQMVEDAARIINHFDAYDIAGIEYHHNRKADSPSGTAISLSEILIKEIGRKKTAVYDKLSREIAPDEMHFASIRCGSIPGTHKILFDSSADTIKLVHTARNRQGFALGAVLAAEWIFGKQGFYTMQDMMKEVM